jgi:hypothetical protein
MLCLAGFSPAPLAADHYHIAEQAPGENTDFFFSSMLFIAKGTFPKERLILFYRT